MIINEDYLKAVSSKKIKHSYYDKTVDHAEQMGVHVDGEKPEKLLNVRRPNEQQEIKDYRLATYEPVTQSLCEKVINTTNKIFNPRLYSFEFPEVEGDDTLENYLMEDYPYYGSMMNFITETFTQKDYGDPNAVIVIIPENFETIDTQRVKPIPYIFEAEELVDFVDDVYYTFVLDKGNAVKIFDQTQIVYYEKRIVKSKETWIKTFEYVHDFGFPTCFRLGGIIKGDSQPYYYESWIRGVLPHWNQVVNLTSDLQAAYVNHLFMEKWEYATECDADGCNSGKIATKVMNGQDLEDVELSCKRCSGTGKVSRSPFGIHTINRDAINPDSPLPTPPAGYIDKSIEIVDKVEDRIAKEEKRGLASINFEIVQMVGADQSGIAKAYDREDLNAFLMRYSRHIFKYVLPNLIYNTAIWRYPDKDADNIIPKINDPKNFNVISLDSLQSEYVAASQANVSSSYLMHIEKEIVDSKFANNEDARLRNRAVINLNPYPSKSTDDILTYKNLGEKDWSIYKFIHLTELVDQAIENDDEFLDMSLGEQRKVIDAMAKTEVDYDAIPVVPPQSINPI